MKRLQSGSQITVERHDLSASIRVAQDAVLDALAPAIDDANFDLMTKSNETGAASVSILEKVRRLLEIKSQTNLLAGLLTEASLVNDASRLEPLKDQINAAQRKIGTDLSAIADSAQQANIAKLSKQLSVIGADDGIIVLRKYELDREHDAQVSFESAQIEAAKLKSLVDDLVADQSQTAKDVSEYAGRQLRSGQLILIVLSLVAILVATLVGWQYVGRNIIRRLGLLSSAMLRIADGEFGIEIKDNREDEIGDMTRALLFFRQATADAASARERDVQEAKKLEVAASTGRFRHP